jgi:hypothetical protein
MVHLQPQSPGASSQVEVLIVCVVHVCYKLIQTGLCYCMQAAAAQTLDHNPWRCVLRGINSSLQEDLLN